MSIDPDPASELEHHSTTRRRLIGAAAAALGVAGISRAFAQDATPIPESSPSAGQSQVLATPVPDTAPLPYLFIQTASQGAWTPVRGQPGAFWLALTDPSPQTIVIRDEPVDAAGTISTAEFFDSVYFSTDRPLQAVISAQTAAGEDVLVVSLFRATYGAALGNLTYIAAKLDDYTDEHGLTPLQGQDANFTLPATFGATSVFITNATCRSTDPDACQFG